METWNAQKPPDSRGWKEDASSSVERAGEPWGALFPSRSRASFCLWDQKLSFTCKSLPYSPRKPHTPIELSDLDTRELPAAHQHLQAMGTAEGAGQLQQGHPYLNTYHHHFEVKDGKPRKNDNGASGPRHSLHCVVLDTQAPLQCSFTVWHTTSMSLLNWQRQQTMWLGKILRPEHGEANQWRGSHSEGGMHPLLWEVGNRRAPPAPGNALVYPRGGV